MQITFSPKNSIKSWGFSSFQPKENKLILVSSFLILLPSLLTKPDTMIKNPVILHIEPMDEVIKFSIGIDPRATFLQLKEIIQQKTGVAVNRQLLFHKQGGDTWSDSSTLESQGFKDAAEVGLIVSPLPVGTQINITITVPGSQYFNVTVEDKVTVWELKQKICTFLNYGPNTFFAPQGIHLSRLFTEMQDDEKLNKYFVNEGSNIIMLFN